MPRTTGAPRRVPGVSDRLTRLAHGLAYGAIGMMATVALEVALLLGLAGLGLAPDQSSWMTWLVFGGCLLLLGGTASFGFGYRRAQR